MRRVWSTAAVSSVIVGSVILFLVFRQPVEQKEGEGNQLVVQQVEERVDPDTAEGHVVETGVAEGKAVRETPPTRKPRKLLPAKVNLGLSREPRLGEMVDVTFRITPSVDLPQMMVIWGKPQKGVEIVGGEKNVYSSVKKGETKSFTVTVKFVSSPVHFGVNAGQWTYTPEGGRRLGRGTGTSFRRVIIDEETGQFGTVVEYRNSKLEFRYDPGDGRWLELGQPLAGPENRRIIEMMKRLESAISDSEALCLHSAQYRVQTPPHIRPKWDEKEQKWIWDDVFRYFLQQGWLKAMREGQIEEWEREQNRKAEDKGGRRGREDNNADLARCLTSMKRLALSSTKPPSKKIW